MKRLSSTIEALIFLLAGTLAAVIIAILVRALLTQ